MERAIIDLEDKFHTTTKRIDDIEWKIESTQTYKNSDCESVVKLLTESKSLKNRIEKISKDITERDIILDEKRSKLRNAIHSHVMSKNYLTENLNKYTEGQSPKQ